MLENTDPDNGSLNHIAIIMDGNARYAKSKKLAVDFGHKSGCDNIAKISQACIDFKIKFLTLYAFSSENWQRPKSEVDYLLTLLETYLKTKCHLLHRQNIKIVVSGNFSLIEKRLINKINEIQELTKNNSALTLNIAFSYGGRQEIIDAVKKICLEVDKKHLTIDKINEESFRSFLYQPNLPDVDLMIRTGGNCRVSNFLLWQLAYSELYFSPILWPEFSKTDLQIIIQQFQQQNRTYGRRISS
jgi:undecaprenyl diphosphate synthase